MTDNCRRSFCLLFHFFEACRADLFALEKREINTTSAENTCVRVFLKYNFVPFNIDFNGIGAAYIHFGTHFLRNYYASKFINVSNNTCGFQFGNTFLTLLLTVIRWVST